MTISTPEWKYLCLSRWKKLWSCKLKISLPSLPPFLDFNSPKSLFLGLWVIQTGYWPDFSLESFIFIKIYLFIKNLTDFRKKVETGVDPHLVSSERPLKIQSQGGNLILANGRLINYPKNLLFNFKTILTHWAEWFKPAFILHNLYY